VTVEEDAKNEEGTKQDRQQDRKREKERVKEAAAREAERVKKAAADEAKRLDRDLEQDPELQEEWLQQDSLIFGGLTGIGILMVQAFLTADSLDRTATICVVAWAIAIPLLASLIMVNRQETFRRSRTTSYIVAGARAVAQTAAFVGLVAGFWHIYWVAGAGFLVTALVAVGVHSAGIFRLEVQPRQRPSTGEKPAGESPSDDGAQSADGDADGPERRTAADWKK
jgi:cation transport ATPase